jgi:hypothetical protein
MNSITFLLTLVQLVLCLLLKKDTTYQLPFDSNTIIFRHFLVKILLPANITLYFYFKNAQPNE